MFNQFIFDFLLAVIQEVLLLNHFIAKQLQ